VQALRSNFPAQLSSETLKKLGIAPRNECATLSIIRNLGFIDDTGRRTAQAAALFQMTSESAFQAGLAAHLMSHYRDLFEIRGEHAWSLPTSDLATYFAQADGTSAKVSRLQARTFQVLAETAGRLSGDAPRNNTEPYTPPPGEPAPVPANEALTLTRTGGVHVHIHITLPADANPCAQQELLQNIRETLIDPLL